MMSALPLRDVTLTDEESRAFLTLLKEKAEAGAIPDGQRADGDNTESDRAFWSTPQAALDEFKRVGDNSRENLEAEKEAKTEN